MRRKLIELAEKPYLKEDLPAIAIGDSVSVVTRIVEANNKERLQRFDGLIISKSGEGTGKSITVRKLSAGVGVERVFLIHSPFIKEIKILATKAQGIRRAKLYHMRGRTGKNARIQYLEKNDSK